MPAKTIYISDKSNALLEDETNKHIKEYSEKYSVDENLIKAIITVESDNNVFAFRYEPTLKFADWYNTILSEKERTNDYSYCSYGLMQVLFAVAKGNGFRGSPTQLFLPEHNIKYGTKLLSTLQKHYKSIPDVISAYNQGSNAKNEDGKYKNQDYVNKVLKAMCPYYEHIR